MELPCPEALQVFYDTSGRRRPTKDQFNCTALIRAAHSKWGNEDEEEQHYNQMRAPEHAHDRNRPNECLCQRLTTDAFFICIDHHIHTET